MTGERTPDSERCLSPLSPQQLAEIESNLRVAIEGYLGSDRALDALLTEVERLQLQVEALKASEAPSVYLDAVRKRERAEAERDKALAEVERLQQENVNLRACDHAFSVSSGVLQHRLQRLRQAEDQRDECLRTFKRNLRLATEEIQAERDKAREALRKIEERVTKRLEWLNGNSRRYDAVENCDMTLANVQEIARAVLPVSGGQALSSERPTGDQQTSHERKGG